MRDVTEAKCVIFRFPSDRERLAWQGEDSYALCFVFNRPPRFVCILITSYEVVCIRDSMHAYCS